jgi:3',5'-cyclic AMP phosphodiesterase CpdA
MQRIAFFSDTHVSPRHGFFVENVQATIAAINALEPDLVVNGGDLSVNGADDARDLRFAAFLMRGVKAPLAIIPGNHDVGEDADHHGQPIDPERIARYREHFGADRWTRDLGPWRLIGVNSLLIGSGLAEERAQHAWLLEAFSRARGRSLGLFMHKPLYIDHGAGDAEWTIDPAERSGYRALFMETGVRFIASGHLHRSRAYAADAMTHIWAPSCAFAYAADLPGDPDLGFAVLDLSDDGSVAARFVRPGGLIDHDYAALKGAHAFLKDCPPAPPSIEWPG